MPGPGPPTARPQRLGQGPCRDAARDHAVVRVDDVRTDPRRPDSCQEAAPLGVGSMLCFQLFVAGDRMGALNPYAREPSASPRGQEAASRG